MAKMRRTSYKEFYNNEVTQPVMFVIEKQVVRRLTGFRIIACVVIMRIRGSSFTSMLVFAILFAAAVCEGALYSITVSPINSSSVPCGYNTLSPCHTLTNAFLTIPTLSNNKSDRVVISIDSGVYSTCGVSYLSLVGNGTAATNIYIVANGNVTLTCSTPSSSIIAQDLPGSAYFVSGSRSLSLNTFRPPHRSI
jgi:hypothetical protein